MDSTTQSHVAQLQQLFKSNDGCHRLNICPSYWNDYHKNICHKWMQHFNYSTINKQDVRFKHHSDCIKTAIKETSSIKFWDLLYNCDFST